MTVVFFSCKFSTKKILNDAKGLVSDSIAKQAFWNSKFTILFLLFLAEKKFKAKRTFQKDKNILALDIFRNKSYNKRRENPGENLKI